jgi:hypothetical protein
VDKTSDNTVFDNIFSKKIAEIKVFFEKESRKIAIFFAFVKTCHFFLIHSIKNGIGFTSG